MTNKDVKITLIDALFDRAGIYTRKVNESEYRTRCPFCGDSMKNEYTGHFYMKINTEDNYPVQYYCFLCQEGGILQPSTLTLLDIDDINLKSSLTAMNKTSNKIDRKGMINEVKIQTFDFEIPGIQFGKKTEYIEDRIGIHGLPEEEFKSMKVITSFRDFLIHNKIKKLMCSNQIAYKLEKNYVGFLSYGNSHILFRDITNKEEYRWIKYPLTTESRDNRIFYSLESEIDLFTDDKITINMAEGVIDIISAKYNLGYDGPNVLNLCVSGKYYDSMILFLVSMGFIGSNITINIFADNDSVFNPENQNTTTTIAYYKSMMSKYKNLFGQCNVYYNLKQKDIGYPRDEIRLERYII